ncbi:MAG: carboxypeptidase regulatory-like domain-containing protein [Limisphaerales bacterium]
MKPPYHQWTLDRKLVRKIVRKPVGTISPFSFAAHCCIIAALNGPNIHRVLVALLCAFFCSNAFSFVFYPVGNQPLRWNVANGLAHANIVNPVTKAVRYYIASDAYSAANRDAEIAAVQACFDQWQSVPGSALKFEFAGFISPTGLDIKRDNTNVVYWAKQSTVVNSGAMDISGLRAWTWMHFAADGSFLEGDIVMNARQFQWFTDFNNKINQGQFIEATLLHEIGHFLGLDHAVAGGATLAIGANGVSTEAGLSNDESAAMRFLYPATGLSAARISGTVRRKGVGIVGAAIIAEDSNGNLVGGTVSREDGMYDLAGLAPGTYGLRVTPLDPANAGVEKLMRGIDVAFEYENAVTTFLPSAILTATVAAGQTLIRDFSVTTGTPMRITSISKPTTLPDLVSVQRHAVTLNPGQANIFVAVSGATLKPNSVLTITGDGITMGPTTFHENRISGNIHSLSAAVSISANATPGLRSFVVTAGQEAAYANGFVEIAAPVIDYNFDTLDDLFQRQYWRRWTAPEASPTADPDADLFSNAFEYRTGSNPTNAASFRLPIHSIDQSAIGTTVIVETESGKRYQLYGTTDLATGWETVGRSFTATGDQLTFTDTNASTAKFYRVALVP